MENEAQQQTEQDKPQPEASPTAEAAARPAPRPSPLVRRTHPPQRRSFTSNANCIVSAIIASAAVLVLAWGLRDWRAQPNAI